MATNVGTFPLAAVFPYIGIYDRLHVSQVCASWRAAAALLWTELDLRASPEEAPRWLRFVGAQQQRFRSLSSVVVEFSHVGSNPHPSPFRCTPHLHEKAFTSRLPRR
mmetsp:Transcript_5772/g.16206  ORF Transcript_5772/g.16206 Transcript_5772/m.16206 type:complete len:107 (+) Transcript_5772:276-596(+)